MPRTEEQKVARREKDRADRADPNKAPRLRAQAGDAGKRWRARHPEKDRRKQRAWAKGTPRGLLASARQSATARGLAFAITEADIKIPERCPVFGFPLNPSADSRADDLPSLDRIDPGHGYVPGNVWVISWKANQLKHNATLADLEALIRAMKVQGQGFRAHAHAWLARKAA